MSSVITKRGRKKKVDDDKEKSKGKGNKKIEESVIGLRTNVRRNEITKDLILHIPLKSTDTEESIFITKKGSTENMPVPYQKPNTATTIASANIFNKERWPKRTDIKCWWCTYNFDNVPCCIPHKYENGCFKVYGNFCSFNCSLAYILQFIEDKKWEKVSLLNMFYREIHNTWGEIVPAPKKEVLSIYGGNVSIDEYRSVNKKITYDLIIPPIFPIKSHVETRNTLESLEKLTQNKLVNGQTTSSQNGMLKIRREVPLIKNNNFINRFRSA